MLARRASATVVNPHDPDALAQRSHLLERWTRQFAPHLAQEEQTLFPALEAAGQEEPVALVRSQHAVLRQLIERLRAGDGTALAEWGDAMGAHVRFEERTLFPLAQTVIDPVNLTDVMKPPSTSSVSSS